MAGQDEVMRLVASVIDDSTGPLAKIRKAWRDTHGDIAKGSHASSKQLREHAKAVRELHERLSKLRDTTVNLVSPAFAAVGLSVAGAAEAIKSLIDATRRYGEIGEKLRYLSRDTQLSVDAMRRFEEMAQRLGVSGDAMDQGMASFNRFMEATARNAPTANNAWAHMGAAMERFRTTLTGLSREDQLKRVLEFGERIRDVGQRRNFYATLGLPEDFATRTRAEIDEALRAADRWNRSRLFDPEGAERVARAWKDAEAAFRGIREDLGAAFQGPEAEGLEKVAKLLSSKETFAAAKEATKFIADQIVLAVQNFSDMYHDFQSFRDLLRGMPGRAHDPAEPEKSTGKSDFHPYGLYSGPKGEAPGKTGHRYDDSAARFAAGIAPIAFRQGVSDPAKMIERAVESGVFNGMRDWFSTWMDQKHAGAGGPTQASFGSADYPNLSDFANGQLPKSVQAVRHQLLTGSRGAEVPAGSGPAPRGVAGGRRDVARIVRDEWKRAGMTDEGIAGLMQNLMDESSLNPNLRHPDQPRYGGEAHYAHGLYQEGGAEWNRYVAWLNKNYPGANWRDPRLQSRFAAWNLKTNYPSVWHRMSSGDRYEAAAAYVGGYLKPAEIYRRSRESRYLRGGVAPLSSYVGAEHRALLRDHIRHQHPHEVHVHHTKLSVDFRNMPRGVHTKVSAAGLFKEVKINRGSVMRLASQEE